MFCYMQLKLSLIDGGRAPEESLGCFPKEFPFKFIAVPLKDEFIFVAKLNLTIALHYYPLLTHIYTIS